jgi:hypothetical protein
MSGVAVQKLMRAVSAAVMEVPANSISYLQI